MNQRIKELVVKSNGYWEHGDHNMPSAVCFQEADLERFAELIVGECIDTVLDCSVEYTTRPQIAQELKEHFGLGMTTEDKKTLIKELLGVKND